MRFFAFVIFCMTFYLVAYASNPELDDLLSKADEMRSADFSGFEGVMNEIELSRDNFTPEQLHYYRYLKGYRDTFNGRVEDAIASYIQIENSNASEVLKLRALGSLVNTYAIKRDFYLGAKAINRLFEQRQKVTDQKSIDRSYVVVSIFYNQARQFQLGLNVSNQLLNRDITPRQECFARQTKVEAEFELANILSDYTYAKQSVDFCEQHSEQLVANVIITFIAESLANENRIEESQQLLSESLTDTIDAKYPPLIGVHYALMAKNYLSMEQADLATEYALKAYESIQNFGLTKALVKSLEVLYRAAEFKNDYRDTVEYLKRYSEAEKAYLDETKTRSLAFQQAQYEKLEQDNTIAFLDQQNTLLKTQAELAKEQSQNNKLALALSLSLLFLLFGWLYRSRKIQIKLRKMAETDELTGISNRHYFNLRAQKHLRQAQQQNQPVSFVLFDLDHFKKVNDTFGHQTGDWALRKSVLEAKLVCRNIDLIGRMGGEEFAIMLPGCQLDEALRVAELCRVAIEKIDTSETDNTFTITASFGVSNTNDCGYNLDKLFAGADVALYESKNSGRNKVYRFKDTQITALQ
ncbi:MAG: GGDEF domain-containing protein [Aliiglaciecola sp.]|uniref:GGDEF domain-containing protein n=1 Tax=Aliiglaciecola sp. M165 TaxID=2593649 RepID=UPI00117E67AB|nr:GGDEF domain-containing protein [Aliiglaciecola sp. M165]TRY32402.1 GGDEF domain-containing protein [Aliiglaciecola sp. M165]